MSSIIHVMHCFDNNYVIPAAVSFYSMLEHANKEYTYELYVLHNDISDTNQEKLRQTIKEFRNAHLTFINMDDLLSETFAKFNNKGYYSKEVLYKLVSPSIFKKQNRLIITDVDVVFLGDISKSWEQLLISDSFYVAGIKSVIGRGSWLEEYYNNYNENFSGEEKKLLDMGGGYLIFNLSNLRKDNIEKKFLTCLKNNTGRLLQAEQDVINLTIPKDKKFYLPLNNMVCSYAYDIYDNDSNTQDYNYSEQEIKDALTHPIQLHYATHTKPWNIPDCTKAEIWFLYLQKTPFFNDWLKYISQKTASSIYGPQIKQQYKRKDKLCFRVPISSRGLLEFKVSKITYIKNRGTKPLVQVVCLTYNHEKFIKKTLEGFIKQQVSFPFEVLVADDASTDNTVNIIKEYAEKYPDIIKSILRKKNIGPGKNALNTLRLIKAKYLAWCDGDDYWIDENKLQKQVDFLEKHVDYSVCCSNVKWHYVDNSNPDKIFKIKDYMPKQMSKKSKYDFDNLLNCRFIASCTCMIRWNMSNNVPNWISDYFVVDFPLFLIHSYFGYIKVFDNVFSQYNIHSAGVSSHSGTKDYNDRMLAILHFVDSFLGFAKHKEIVDYIRDNYL